MSGYPMTDDHTMRSILKTAKVIAVVGLSEKPDRPSHGVSLYLQTHGYAIIIRCFDTDVHTLYPEPNSSHLL